MNYNVQPRLVGGAVGVWGVWERSDLPQKSPTVLSEPKFGPPPPHQKFLDPPLT